MGRLNGLFRAIRSKSLKESKGQTFMNMFAVSRQFGLIHLDWPAVMGLSEAQRLRDLEKENTGGNSFSYTPSIGTPHVLEPITGANTKSSQL